jgi:hypothetical protein
MHFKKTAKVIFSIQLFLAVFLFAQYANAEEKITNFDSVIKVEKSGIIDITEKITYDFSDSPSSEISRNIEKVLSNASEIGLKVSSVTDEKGNKYEFLESLENNTFHIQIRNNDKPFMGVKNFIINYKVIHAVDDYYDEDRLLWVAAGVDTSVPISQTKITVDLSELQNLDMNKVIIPNCYNISNCTISEKDFKVIYSGFSGGKDIQLFIPKGSINWPPEPPIEQQSLKDMFLPYVRVIFGMFLFVMILDFIKRFNTPKNDIPRQLKKKPIITEYEPPVGLSPIEAGTIINRLVDNHDVSSVIMDLALRGYIKIDFSDGTKFIKLKTGDDLVNPADKEIFQAFFQYRDQVSLDTLKKSREIMDSAERIASATEEYLSQNGYIYKFAKSKFKKFEIPLMVVASVAFMTMYFSFVMMIASIEKVSDLVIHNTTTLVFVLSLVSFVASGYLYRKMTVVLTAKGIEVYAKLLGFKKFLSMTEKDRLEFCNAPKVKPEVIEKFLPYAMVLHVENKWSKVFDGLYKAKGCRVGYS